MSEYDRTFWEERWSQALREHGDRVAQRPPNAHLTAEVGDLRPGRALDAGCGHGSDTLWLAAHGWQVTAVDFAATALAYARSTAEAMGPDVAGRVDRVEADLASWAPRRTTSWSACMSTWRGRSRGWSGAWHQGWHAAGPWPSATLLGDEPEKTSRRQMAKAPPPRQVQIAGERFRLRARDVERTMLGIAPEPITSHFVVVGSRRYPPKQVISAVTGLDRADFTTHQARRILMRLGFVAGRRVQTAQPSGGVRRRSNRSAQETIHDAPTIADRLRPLAGSWVAIRDGDVLHSADTPQQLVSWLSTHGQQADSMYRVPDGELAATGLAPL